MNKNHKFLLALTLTLGISIPNVAFADVTPQQSKITTYSNEDQLQSINLTPQDIKEGTDKLKIAESYINNKKKTKLKSALSISPSYATGWGDWAELSVPYRVEEPNLCGPASAQIAILYKHPEYDNGTLTQKSLAMDLGYSSGSGTPFGSYWTSTLNRFMPANNYTLLKGSSFSDWKSHMENGIMYTIDKGYAVIVDTHMYSSAEKDNPARVNYSYSYLDARGKGCFHYIVANGYDNTDGNDLILITDCNDYPNFPHTYWCSASSLADVSKEYGIIY